MQFRFDLIGLAILLIATEVNAAVHQATPADYEQKIGQLEPGDTLQLAPGTYELLSLSDLHGTPEAWITVQGPTSGSPAVITANPCCNTVQIRRSSYLALRHVTVDSGGIAGLDGINAKDGQSHHVLIENNHIRGVGGSQQTVGISTKSTTWNWIIRGNVIEEPGTGIYLGDSTGAAPFIAGIVEGNLILHPEGYAMQIKHQISYQHPASASAGKVTLIRHNVFSKDGRPSGDGDRPLLLVGGFPDSGQGADHRYEIYGNFLLDNPRESLIQATGSVVIHDNVLAGSGPTAILLTDHNGELKNAHVYNNTIYGSTRGIRFGSSARESHSVIGNAVFAEQPISGAYSVSADNVEATVAEASSYLVEPSLAPGIMDLFPASGSSLEGAPLTYPEGYSTHRDFDQDFNGRNKGNRAFRGVYAGAGTNPGWTLSLSRKPLALDSRPMPPVLLDD